MLQESLRENVGSLLPKAPELEKPFWEGLQNKQLLVQKCPECGHVQFPPSPVCTQCLSDKTEWAACSGKATLWSKVRFHKAYLKPYPDVPYAVGLAKLEEGPIVTGRLSPENDALVKPDGPLALSFVTTRDGTVLLEFVPDSNG